MLEQRFLTGFRGAHDSDDDAGLLLQDDGTIVQILPGGARRTITGGGGGGGSEPVLVGATAAALSAQNPADGQLGLVRIGSWPNVYEELLVWNDTAGVWVGEEKVAITQADGWSMELNDMSIAQLTDWCRFQAPLSVAQGQVMTWLTVGGNSNDSAFTVDDTTDFDAAGTFRLLDCRFAYTGKTATSFTGVTREFGPAGETIPVDSEMIQGNVGGFGTAALPVVAAGEMFAAGFQLQEKLVALTNASLDNKRMSVAPFWRQFDDQDALVALDSPPAGGLGVSAALLGSANVGGNIGSERNFYATENGWSDWPLAAPTKRYLLPALYGKMASSAQKSGQVLDAKLVVRWTS